MTSEFIPYDNLRDGLHLAMQYAEYFLNMSKKLHDNNEFQISIPYAILAFEESSKAHHLDDNRFEGLGISDEEWKSIRNHEYKLTDAEKQTKKELENQTDAFVNWQGSVMEGLGLNGIHDRKIAIMVKQKQIEIYSRFSTIKERCFYANWNKRKNNWESLNGMTDDEKRLLSMYILNLAEHKYLLAKFAIEAHENPFRKPPKGIEFSYKETSKYLQEKLEHHKALKSVQEMRDFDKKTESILNEASKGLDVLNKYFSN
ncbi:MAG: AbiV family abortive infection protein [Patescibacteria group bacterium]|nr:AbiV family abortive infection protein [Patescibacteria group bacterium]